MAVEGRAPELVIIVGGGLAGLTMGTKLVERGFQVVVFERGTYPRNLNTSGLLTQKAESLLEEIVGPIPQECVISTIKSASLFADCKKVTSTDLEEEIKVVDRAQLDLFVAQDFQNRGGQIYQGHTITGIDPTEQAVFMNDASNQGKKLNYTKLVIASGAGSVHQYIQGEKQIHLLANTFGVHLKKQAKPSMDLDFDFLKDGRAMMTPMNDTTLITVSGYGITKEILYSYLETNHFDLTDEETFSAVIPYGYNKFQITEAVNWASQGIFLLGEALGIINPVTGEGASLSLMSVEATYPTLITMDIESYENSIKKVFDLYERMTKMRASAFKNKKMKSTDFMFMVDAVLNKGEVDYDMKKMGAARKEYENLKKIKADPKKLEKYEKAEEKKAIAEAKKLAAKRAAALKGPKELPKVPTNIKIKGLPKKKGKEET